MAVSAAVLAILLFAAAPAWAAFGNWQEAGNYELTFGGGDGSLYSPYEINSAAQLAGVAYQVLNDNATYGGKHYKLTSNIELYEHYWTPIGNGSAMFSGTFDGDGHTIDGLNINVEDNSQYHGLFGVVYGGTVKKVNLAGVSILGDGVAVGGLAGRGDGGALEDCSVIGVVSGHSVVGGLVGANENNSEIRGCSMAGAVSESDSAGTAAGGLVGYNADSVVENCSAASSVRGWLRVGGLVGYNSGSGSVVRRCVSAGDVDGTTEVGGLVGCNDDGSVTDNHVYDSVEVNGVPGGLPFIGYANAGTDRGNFPMPPPALTVLPASLNFGEASPGYAQPAAQSVTISNGTSAMAALSGVNLSGDNPEAFELVGGRLMIAPGDSSVWMVGPVAGLPAGEYKARVYVGHNGENREMSVSFTVSSGGDPGKPGNPGNPGNPGDPGDDPLDGGNPDSGGGCDAGVFGAGALILAALTVPLAGKISRKRRG